MTMHLPATRADLVVPFLASFVLLFVALLVARVRWLCVEVYWILALWFEQACLCLVRPVTMHLPANRIDLVVRFLASFVLLFVALDTALVGLLCVEAHGGLTLWSEQECLVRPVMRVLNHLSGLSACDDALTSY